MAISRNLNMMWCGSSNLILFSMRWITLVRPLHCLVHKFVFRALNADPTTDARRHVNKMCIAGNIPLVESGTAGYLGQVQPLLKVCRKHYNNCGNIYLLTSSIGYDRMLWLCRETDPEIISRVHDPFHSLTGHSLYSLGQKLPLRVRNLHIWG